MSIRPNYYQLGHFPDLRGLEKVVHVMQGIEISGWNALIHDLSAFPIENMQLRPISLNYANYAQLGHFFHLRRLGKIAYAIQRIQISGKNALTWIDSVFMRYVTVRVN